MKKCHYKCGPLFNIYQITVASFVIFYVIINFYLFSTFCKKVLCFSYKFFECEVRACDQGFDISH